jgi:hypothetical protein
MRVIKFFIAFAVLSVFGLAAFSYYWLLNFEKESNRKRTEPARAARLSKLKEEKEEGNETETEKESFNNS